MKPDHDLSMLVFLVNVDIMLALFLADGASLGAGPSSQGTSHGMGTDGKFPISDGTKTIIFECIASSCL